MKSTFSSPTDLAATIDCKMASIQKAKQAGADGFKGSTIDIRKLLRWFLHQQSSADISWHGQLTRAKAEREKLRLSHDQGELLEAGQVRDICHESMAVLWRELDRRLVNELPGVVAGMTPKQLQTHISRDLEAAKQAATDSLGRLDKKPA